jgi:hypothetical protein
MHGDRRALCDLIVHDMQTRVCGVVIAAAAPRARAGP